MLEIFLLVFLCRKIGDIMRLKNRNPLGLQVFTVLSWFGGELFGAVIGTIVLMIIQGEKAVNDGINLWVYLAALICAAISVAIVFIIAKLIPEKQIQAIEPVYEDTEFSSDTQ